MAKALTLTSEILGFFDATIGADERKHFRYVDDLGW
jgi:hypothetical protein